MADQIFSSTALNTAVQLCAEIRAKGSRGFRLCIDIFDSAGEHGVFHKVEKAGRQRSEKL